MPTNEGQCFDLRSVTQATQIIRRVPRHVWGALA